MGQVLDVRSTAGVSAALVAAQDGDTIRLVWPDVTGFNRLAVESRAVALGLDVVVVAAPGGAGRTEVMHVHS